MIVGFRWRVALNDGHVSPPQGFSSNVAEPLRFGKVLRSTNINVSETNRTVKKILRITAGIFGTWVSVAGPHFPTGNTCLGTSCLPGLLYRMHFPIVVRPSTAIFHFLVATGSSIRSATGWPSCTPPSPGRRCRCGWRWGFSGDAFPPRATGRTGPALH